jgi:hypothetical protein
LFLLAFSVQTVATFLTWIIFAVYVSTITTSRPTPRKVDSGIGDNAMITDLMRDAVRCSRQIKFYIDGKKPSDLGTVVFEIEGRDVNPLCLLWVQANPIMRNLNTVRLERRVEDNETVFMECL